MDIAYEDVYHNAIRKALKSKMMRYNKVSVVDYAQKVATTSQSFDTDEIAIIYAQGEIMGVKVM
jgi:protease-4